MKKADLDKINLPKSPGVYIFRGSKNKPLYIGKAVDLRNRVKSYFTANHRLVTERGAHIAKMVEEAKELDFIETQSGAEAVVLEANLIKKYEPQYNTKEKSGKSFNFVLITNEEFPKVKVVRGKDIKKLKSSQIKYIFGPFTESMVLKRLLKIVREIFPYTENCTPPKSNRLNLLDSEKEGGKKCFYAQIGLCPGVCVGKISKKEYSKNIQNIKRFFEGKKDKIIVLLQKEMERQASRQNFEKAARIRDKIFALQNIKELALVEEIFKAGLSGANLEIKRIEGYDISHTALKNRVGAMVAFQDGEFEKSSYRIFNIKTEKEGDTDALEEVLKRRFKHKEWKTPELVVIDGGVAQKRVAMKVIKSLGLDVEVVSVLKDEKHRPKRILGNKKVVELYKNTILSVNNEAHRFVIGAHRRKRGRGFIR